MTITSMAKQIAFVVALPVVLLVMWWVTTASSTDPYVPPLQEIFATFPDTWSTDRLMNDAVPEERPTAIRFCTASSAATLVVPSLPIGPRAMNVHASPPRTRSRTTSRITRQLRISRAYYVRQTQPAISVMCAEPHVASS